MDYKNILEGIVKIISTTDNSDIGFANIRTYICENCPEFSESRDEKIRKWLIGYFRQYKEDGIEKYANGLKVDSIIAWLEKQGEQKPIDKSKPKFNVGDWIIFNENHNSIYQVERIDNYRYYLRHYLGGTLSVHFDNELIRQWTIQDAKEGDILINKANDAILIFKSIRNNYLFSSYCDYFVNTFRVKQFSQWASSAFIPATKEQRELLFKKMKEAGYEWNEEKKELKKVDQKHTWSEEDERNLEGIIDEIETNKNQAPDYDLETYDRFLFWLKSLKERIGE